MTAEEVTSDHRVSSLRGAGVAQFDRRRLVRAAAAVLVVGLAAGSVALYVAGARKNAQITDLREHGVGVEITITGCLGLLGGSGSNDAGYACRGAFVLGGRRHVETIPGDTLYPPGTKVDAVAVPGDPGVVATAQAVAVERPSSSVYVLPSVLAALDVVLLAGLVLRWRRESGLARPRARRLAGQPVP